MTRGLGWLLAPVLLCLAALLLAVGAGPVELTGDSPLDRIRPVELPVEEAAEPGSETVVEIEAPRRQEAVLGVPVEVVVALLVTTTALALLARSLLRARGDAPTEQHDDDVLDGSTGGLDTAAVAEAARAGLLRLADVPAEHAADVVVACWVELELAAGGTVAARRFTDTPSDFAARLADAVPGLDRDALDRLRRTYSRVRYAAHGDPARRVGTEEAAAARAALASLVTGVRSGA